MKNLKKNKNEFYNISKIASYNYKINMICGERFGGKSTAVQKYVIKKAIQSRYKSHFAVFVKYKDDIKEFCNQYFENVMYFYPDFTMRYENKKFYLKKKNSPVEHIVGYAFAINIATKKKSTGYPTIDTIIVEEFLNLDSNYITKKGRPLLEVELFNSLYETIARGKGQKIRDVKCFLVSNNYYINNPYYNYYELIKQIIEDPTKQFYINKKLSCVLEMTHNGADTGIRKKENDGSYFVDLENQVQILKNYKPAKKVIYYITNNNKTHYGFTMYNNSFYIFKNKNKLDKDAFIITTSEIAKFNYINIKLFKTFEIAKNFKKLFLINKLYYDKFETFIEIKNIMELL